MQKLQLFLFFLIFLVRLEQVCVNKSVIFGRVYKLDKTRLKLTSTSFKSGSSNGTNSQETKTVIFTKKLKPPKYHLLAVNDLL